MLEPNQNIAASDEVTLTQHSLQHVPFEVDGALPLTKVTEVVASSSQNSKVVFPEAEPLSTEPLSTEPLNTEPLNTELSEAGKKFVELLTKKLKDQGLPPIKSKLPKDSVKSTPRKRPIKESKLPKGHLKQPSSVYRITEMADKFMRIVEEHCNKMPHSLPPNSPVFSDRRIIAMLNSREFIPDVSLSHAERDSIVKKHLPELYEILRKRFFCDYLGKRMDSPQEKQGETNSETEVQTQNSAAKDVVPATEATLADIDGPAVGQALRESTAAAESLQGGDTSGNLSPESSSDDHVDPVVAESPVRGDPDELSETKKLRDEEEIFEKKKEERKPALAIKPFSSQLLATRLVELEFPAIFNTFLDTRLDLVTILDLLNVSRRELLSVPNFKEKRLSDVQDTLSRLHPGAGLLFASVRSFPLPVEVVDKLEKSSVLPSIFIDGKLAQDLYSSKLPLDNGLRLLYMTPEIMRFASITREMHAAVAERFFKVGFRV